MKASRFSDAQKAFILKQGAEGVPVADICRKVGLRLCLRFVFDVDDLLDALKMSRKRAAVGLARPIAASTL